MIIYFWEYVLKLGGEIIDVILIVFHLFLQFLILCSESRDFLICLHANVGLWSELFDVIVASASHNLIHSNVHLSHIVIGVEVFDVSIIDLVLIQVLQILYKLFVNRCMRFVDISDLMDSVFTH